MSRWTDSLNQAAAELDIVRGCWLVDLAFDSGHVRANDSLKDIVVGANTYYGVGGFGEFDGIEESVEFVARGVRMGLAAVDSGLVSTIVNEQYQCRAATLYVAMLDANNQLIATPEARWSGFMDTMPIQISGREAKIVVNCEHRMRNAPPYSRFANADQQGRSTGDQFFEQLHFVAGYTGTWGGKGTTWNFRGGGYPG